TEPGAAPRTPAALLAAAETVILGFDGPLARLYTPATAQAAARDLGAILADPLSSKRAYKRKPQHDAVDPTEGLGHPLDVLRAFAEHPRAGKLRTRLEVIELRASLEPTPHAEALIHALNLSGRKVAIATDTSAAVVGAYLQHLGSRTSPFPLPLGSIVHGRADDLRCLMPNPDCLLRALAHLGRPASAGVMIGSSPAELAAARAIGLGFIGYAYDDETRNGLTAAGCESIVYSLEPLIEAITAG
ncbi:HAD family hydrolase, partial [Streptomyces sp. T-3]|nr:HAD family hydrolase [Streptomyces sp. T-3]